MTTLILVRHGESKANKDGIFAGHIDVDLDEKGTEQAKITAEYIARTYNVHKVYASDLKRAYITGKCISDILGIEIIADEKLREIYSGKWQGMKFDDILATYTKDYNVWLNDIGNARCTGGESVAELQQRIVAEVTKIAKENEGKTVVIATHATAIRTMQCFAEGKILSQMKNVPWTTNSSISVLEYDSGKWNFSKLSYDGHLGNLKTNFPKNV